MGTDNSILIANNLAMYGIPSSTQPEWRLLWRSPATTTSQLSSWATLSIPTYSHSILTRGFILKTYFVLFLSYFLFDFFKFSPQICQDRGWHGLGEPNDGQELSPHCGKPRHDPVDRNGARAFQVQNSQASRKNILLCKYENFVSATPNFWL